MRLRDIILTGALSALILTSCSSTKQISYFQDLTPGSETAIAANLPLKLQPNDKVSILVSTGDPRLNTLFNLPVPQNRISDSGSSASNGNGDIAPYTIDRQGDITFPVLGKVHAAGLTREQLAEHIRRELMSRDLAKNPIVTVDYLNLSVSVMGEVAHPGRFAISREDFTILDALSQAGDLTIYGKRDDIRVLREENGVQKVYSVNLNSGRELTQSPVYYLQQNDVVYVEPNATKARLSTPNGNIWTSPTLWISIASFLTTVAVLIVK